MWKRRPREGRPAGTRRMSAVLARFGRRILIALILCLALIGFLHLTRGTAVRHVRGVANDGVPIGVREPQFPLIVTMMTGAWLSAGNRVEVTLNGDGTYPRLWDDLRSARQSITLQLYYGNAGRTGDLLRQILLERASAGVRVFLLYDAFGSLDIPASHLAALRAGGVVVEPYRPLRLSTLHVFQNRSHVRGIVIDGRIGWTGGFGIDDKWLGDGRTGGSWRETNVRFEGPAVRQLQAAFATSWAEATGELFSGRATVQRYEGGVAAAALLHTSPTVGSTPAERFLAISIAGAQKTLYITNSYFAPERTFIELLTDAARRGVDVRILTAGPVTDVRTVRLAGRAWYATLLAAGVRIYEWQPSTLHAKTFVVDGLWSTVGSMNFDNRSLVLNDEANLMILDPDVGQEMNAAFVEDLRYSEEILPAKFAQRSLLQR